MRKLEVNSHTFFSEIDTSLVQFINKQSADSTFSDSGHGDSSILVLFVKDSGNLIRLITHQLIYLPPELISVRKKMSDLPSSMKEVQRLEFTERKYQEALRFYQDKALKTSNASEKIHALVASARCTENESA